MIRELLRRLSRWEHRLSEGKRIMRRYTLRRRVKKTLESWEREYVAAEKGTLLFAWIEDQYYEIAIAAWFAGATVGRRWYSLQHLRFVYFGTGKWRHRYDRV